MTDLVTSPAQDAGPLPADPQRLQREGDPSTRVTSWDGGSRWLVVHRADPGRSPAALVAPEERDSAAELVVLLLRGSENPNLIASAAEEPLPHLDVTRGGRRRPDGNRTRSSARCTGGSPRRGGGSAGGDPVRARRPRRWRPRPARHLVTPLGTVNLEPRAPPGPPEEEPGRTAIDEHARVASGQCVTAAPDVLDQRVEDGTVVLLDDQPPAGSSDDVHQAAHGCPALAIVVAD